MAPDYNGGVMLLLTDGTVITKTYYGGFGSTPGTMWDKLTPDSTGSYINGTWSQIAPMHSDRLYFASWVLSDGQVFVGGGEYGAGTGAEIYDPVSNTWDSLSTPGENFYDGNSENLPDGRLLLGVNTGTTLANYFFDHSTNTFTTAPSCIASHDEAAWLKLPDSSILQIDIFSTNSERYIPKLNRWVTDGTVPEMLYDTYGFEAGAAFMLPDGRGFFIGSTSHTAFYTPSGDTTPGTWSAGPDLPSGLGAPDAPAAMMVNGKLLLTLSPTPTSSTHFPTPTYYYEFDYTTDSFTQVGAPGGGTSIPIPTYISTMLALPDGNILYSIQGDPVYFVYTPGSGPTSGGKPTVDGIVRVNCDTFKATGKLFNGISEGASYGDDWMMSTNYPMVRIITSTKTIYAKTFGWNRQGAVRTGTAEDTVSFALPAGLAVGTYHLQIVVNGYASDTASFNTTLGIAGTPSVVCQAGTALLTDSSNIGLWSSSNTSIATIGSGTGVVAGITGGVVTISYSAGACYSVKSITVNPQPAAITGSSSLCPGGVSVLGSSTPSGTWASSSLSVLTIGTASGSVTAIAAGSADVTYTLPTGCFITSNITVNPAPPAISGAGLVCAGANISLSETVGGGWSSGAPGVATIGSANGIVTGVSAGSTLITYTLPTGCFTTATITVNSSPGAVSGSASLCNGGSTSLSDAGGGYWISGATTIATVGSTTGLVSGISVGTSPVTYTLPDGCFIVTVVTVNPPTYSISGTSEICVAGTSAFSASGSGNWSSSNGSVATVGSGTGIVSGVGAGNAVVTYTPVTGCPSTSNVTIDPLPALISGPTNVCAGSNITLTDAGGGTWSSGATAVATIGSSTGVLDAFTVGIAPVNYTISTGCSVTTNITVNPLPGSVSGSSVLCQGSSGTLSCPGGGTWLSGNSSVATIGSATGVLSAISSGVDTVTYTLPTGCYTTQNVSVNPLPASIAGVTVLCVGSSASLTDASSGSWSSSNPFVATVGSTSGVVLATGAGVDTISFTSPAGCSSVALMTVNSLPGSISGIASMNLGTNLPLTDATPAGTWSSGNLFVATIGSSTGVATAIAPGTSVINYSVSGCGVVATLTVSPIVSSITGGGTVCQGSSITLSDVSFGGIWVSSNASIATVGSGTGSVTGVATGTATISYIISGYYATRTVTVLPLPTAISGAGNICQGSVTTLSDGTAGGNWSSSNSSVAIVGSSTAVVTGVDSGFVNISYSNSCGSATHAMTINPLPNPGTITGGNLVCLGSPLPLSTGGVTGGIWSATNTIVAIGSSTGMVTGAAIGNNVITYTVTNSFGCSAFSTLAVTVTGVPGNIYTLAGIGTSGYTGDGGPAYLASLTIPRCIATDAIGNIYICDVAKNIIRKINTSGIITTVAGTGTAGYSGDGGPATAAKLNSPNGLFIDRLGNIIISDYNHVLRKINVSTHIISTIAGNGSPGYNRDGIPATSAQLSYPLGVCEDTSGNIYIADQGNYRVRKIDASTGLISTIIGTGTNGYSGDGGLGSAASIGYVRDVQTDNHGNLFIADGSNMVVRKYALGTGIISTIGGTGTTGSSGDGGPATAATFNTPARVAFDGGSLLYVSDQMNFKLRVINMANGKVSTVCGIGISGYTGDNAVATGAKLAQVSGVAVDYLGNVFVADANNYRIREIPGQSSISIALSGSSSVPAGTPITFYAFAPNSGSLVYQWQKNGANVGTSSNTYTNSTPANGDVYRCILKFTPECGSAYYDTSNNIAINVYDHPSQFDSVTEVGKQQLTGQITLFPNPAQGMITVTCSNFQSGGATLYITDQLGRTVLMKEVDVATGGFEEKIEIKSLPPSVYFVNVIAANGSVARIKFIKS